MASQQQEAGRKGGNAPHPQKGERKYAGGADNGRTHQQNIRAGREGGKLVSADREHMSEIGQKGGEAYHEKRGNHGTDNSSK